MATRTYEFRFDPRFRPLLGLAAVTPDRAHVRIDDGTFTARFGPWVVRTAVANIVEVSVTGPHNPLKAIGTRLSLADRGLTFGSNANRTVCIRFEEPVRGIEPTGTLRHPALSLSVADPHRLAEDLRTLGAA